MVSRAKERRTLAQSKFRNKPAQRGFPENLGPTAYVAMAVRSRGQPAVRSGHQLAARTLVSLSLAGLNKGMRNDVVLWLVHNGPRQALATHPLLLVVSINGCWFLRLSVPAAGHDWLERYIPAEANWEPVCYGWLARGCALRAPY